MHMSVVPVVVAAFLSITTTAHHTFVADNKDHFMLSREFLRANREGVLQQRVSGSDISS
jgi:hypothetical protein